MQTIFNTPSEMTVHLAALRVIAEADGVVSDDERRYLENLEQLYRARFPDIGYGATGDKDQDLPSLLKLLTGQRNKMVFLQDLLSMASIDGVVSSEEVKKISEIASLLGLSEQSLDTLFSLNRDLLEANRKLAEFLFAH